VPSYFIREIFYLQQLNEFEDIIDKGDRLSLLDLLIKTY